MVPVNGVLIKILASVLFCIYIVLAWGYAAGITGQTQKGGVTAGCYCHNGSPSGSVNVVISGPDSVAAGETASFTVTISGGPLTRGGTDIAVSRGELILVNGSGLREDNGELTHTFPKSPAQGSVSFSFSYKAPPVAGIDTIFANGNSVNFDLHPNGDQWNFAPSKIIRVFYPIGIKNISSIAEKYTLGQNYPNPFNPATKIRFVIPPAGNGHDRYLQVKIYDMLGQEVETLVNGKFNPGVYEIDWNSGNYPGGVYFYRLITEDFSETKKMVLVK
jgi:hypothetical protein